jgi:two-component system, cell cycle sensor histidine kinase and response regulator CckA
MSPLRVLFVEDSAEDAEILALALETAGYPVSFRHRVWSAEDLRSALARAEWDLVLCGSALPAFECLEALAVVREGHPDLPFFLVSGRASEDLAVSALKAGADDFLVKSNLGRLGPAVARALREKQGREDRKRAEAALRESEEQLRQAQRMESVGRLAGGIAHDFNNILSVVSGYANLLQMKLARNGISHRELAEIEKAVIRATSLVKQLLTFSRRQVVQRQLLDLGRVLQDCMSILPMMLGEDILLETFVSPLLDRVHADRGQMEQVIMNLAVNARDAMPKGGTLRIEITGSELDAAKFREGETCRPGPYIRLAIRDNGVGMDESTLSRIFEPFFTTKGEVRGTGLGLSTVYGIVRQANGIIRVQSIPYAGSAFEIYLPAVPAEADSDRHDGRDSVARTAKGESILLVEDDYDLRKLSKDLLVMEGYKVLEARDAEEAMGFARAEGLAIHLLLTDIVMPGLNGRDLAETVLTLRPELKVVFMSGYAPETMMPDGGWPESAFLEKPFTAAKLLTKVRTALDAPQAEKQL